jgi:hypothetical protein
MIPYAPSPVLPIWPKKGRLCDTFHGVTKFRLVAAASDDKPSTTMKVTTSPLA